MMPEIIDCEARTGPGAEGETTCPICLEAIEQDTETLTHIICKNTFCRECLQRWVQEQKQGGFAGCPIDRLIIGIGDNDEVLDPMEVDDAEHYDDDHLEEEGGFSTVDEVLAGESGDFGWDLDIFVDYQFLINSMQDDLTGRHVQSEGDGEDDQGRSATIDEG